MWTYLHSKGIYIMPVERGKKAIDIAGKSFNRWTVVKRVDKPTTAKASGTYWLCKCVCGEQRTLRGADVKHGYSKSCGCLRKEVSEKSLAKRQLEKHGTLEDRFFDRFKKMDSGCWQWTSHSDKDGYGVLPGNSKNTRAHRFSYEFHKGAIGLEVSICHTCDNPGCVNPEHLFEGTTKDNIQDCIEKRRGFVSEKSGRAKLNWDAVNDIRTEKYNDIYYANKYSVNRTTISLVRLHKTWNK